MAAPSRPYEIRPVLVRRDVPRMAAAFVVAEDRDEKVRDTNERRGATRLQQLDAIMNGTWEGQPPKSPPQPTTLPTEMEEILSSRTEQSSSLAIPTPVGTEETILQAIPIPSISTDATLTALPELVTSAVRPTLTAQADVNINGTSTIRAASTTVPAFLVDSGAKINEEALPGMNQEDPLLVTVPGMNQGTSRSDYIRMRQTLISYLPFYRGSSLGDRTRSNADRSS